jgi:hypothetical protein
LPPSPHVKEPSVTAHYEHYAHDEWSIRDLLHGKIIRPYPSPFLVSSPVAFKFLNVLVLNIAEKLLDVKNQSINQKQVVKTIHRLDNWF